MHCHASKKEPKESCGQPTHFFCTFPPQKEISLFATGNTWKCFHCLHTHTHTSEFTLNTGSCSKMSFVVTVKEEQRWACLNHYVPLWPSLTLIYAVHLKRITSVWSPFESLQSMHLNSSKQKRQFCRRYIQCEQGTMSVPILNFRLATVLLLSVWRHTLTPHELKNNIVGKIMRLT